MRVIAAVIFGAGLMLAGGCQKSTESPAETPSESAASTGSASAAAEGAPGKAVAPSFDCAKAGSSAEEMVCKDSQLAQLDNELARLYKLAEATPGADSQRMNELRAMQRGWVKGRDDCWKADDKHACVVASYGSRIMELRQGYAHARSADAAGITIGPKALACDGLKFGIGVVFVNAEPPIAQLAWLDQAVTLTRSEAGSGAKYTGSNYSGDYVLWTKGEEALLTMPGKAETSCRIEEIG